MDYLFCYDVSDNKLRKRLAKLLQRFGCSRVQKSVFFGSGLNQKQVGRLLEIAESIFGQAPQCPDQLIAVPLPADVVPKVEVAGNADNWTKALEELDDLFL